MNEYLFAYGTLQQDRVQLELFGRLLKGTKDSLDGFILSSIKIQDESFPGDLNEIYLIIRPDSGIEAAVEGTVYELTSEELQLADSYEPREYTRISVTLRSGKRSWVYAATDTI